MRLVQAASWLHKWLALIIGVQVLFWVVSGLFFAVFPIEEVRSEHRIAQVEPAALDPAMLAPAAALAARLPQPPLRLIYERDALGRAVAVAEFGEGRPILMDAADGRVLSPLTADAATQIARAHVSSAPTVGEVREITVGTPEYRGVLPAWRVAFEDGLAVYVAADTGRVTARRSDLWRVYDALWALHIMDWRDHEDFNTWWLVAASVISLAVVLAGFVLFPYRLGWVRRKRAP
jgi:uncharacterized protein YpmB